jgi:hypothetical protein
MNPAFAQTSVDWQITVVIEQQMQLHRSLGLAAQLYMLRHRSITLASRLRSLFLQRSFFFGARLCAKPS